MPGRNRSDPLSIFASTWNQVRPSSAVDTGVTFSTVKLSGWRGMEEMTRRPVWPARTGTMSRSSTLSRTR